MNRKTTALQAVMACLLLSSLFSGCKKNVDFIDLYKFYKKGSANWGGWNIQRVSVTPTDEGYSGTANYNFTYNAAGDPLVVKNDWVGTGNPNMVFKYDRRGRLCELIRPYANNFYESWEKYTYNNQGQIVLDSVYSWAEYIDSVPRVDLEYGYAIRRYSYDGYGRIVGRVDSLFGPGYKIGNAYTFQYDARGNKVLPGTVYDNNACLTATNKVWMFVCNNYSVNNCFKASSYNSSGLPLLFDGDFGVMDWVVPFRGHFNVAYSRP